MDRRLRKVLLAYSAISGAILSLFTNGYSVFQEEFSKLDAYAPSELRKQLLHKTDSSTDVLAPKFSAVFWQRSPAWLASGAITGLCFSVLLIWAIGRSVPNNR